jgi:hypothetical protein
MLGLNVCDDPAAMDEAVVLMLALKVPLLTLKV